MNCPTCDQPTKVVNMWTRVCNNKACRWYLITVIQGLRNETRKEREDRKKAK